MRGTVDPIINLTLTSVAIDPFILDYGLGVLFALVFISALGLRLLSSQPRICPQCAVRSEGRHWWRFVYAVFAVLLTANALTLMVPDSGAFPYRNISIPWIISLSLIAYFAGVLTPTCAECGAHTIDVSSPKGDELLRDYPDEVEETRDRNA